MEKLSSEKISINSRQFIATAKAIAEISICSYIWYIKPFGFFWLVTTLFIWAGFWFLMGSFLPSGNRRVSST
jgi:hypothetical protein